MTASLLSGYHWWRVLGFDALQDPPRQPDIAREFGKLTWRKAVFIKPLPVNTAGEWSPRQAFRVMEAVREEAEQMGLMVVPVDITTMGGPKRVILEVLCRRHDVHVSLNSVCEECAKDFPV